MPKQAASLYTPENHDACGVGFLARLDGACSHAIVEDAITALARMAHRGGACFTPETPDGAGLLMPLPKAFLRKVWQPLCKVVPEHAALGHFFLPPDAEDVRRIEDILEEVCRVHDLFLLGKRDTPVRKNILGPHAASTCPLIRQYLLAPGEKLVQTLRQWESAVLTASGDGAFPVNTLSYKEHFERVLYIARRHLENTVRIQLAHVAESFHICSLSASSVVYKGLLSGGSLAAFYADLADRDFAVHFAVFHERYSTNTQPAWRLAQPFRCLAHNGEINTIACNKANMALREPLLSSPLYGEHIRQLVPVLDPLGSDSAMLDNCLEFLAHGGRSFAHAAMMLMPEPFGPAFITGEDKRAFYEYHAALMEPWDGPSAVIFTDGGKQLGALLDRNALRPCRYARTNDGLFLLASEAGLLDWPEARIAEKGQLHPRRMLMIDFARHRVITDAECKGRVIYSRPYRHWVREKSFSLKDLSLPTRPLAADGEKEPGHGDAGLSLPEALPLFGYGREDIRDILIPMAASAQEPVASMGTDIPLAVLSGKPQLLFHYFKQRFAQVTNPPIDPLREGLVMSLAAFAGKTGNLLEEGPEHYTRLRLNNPLLDRDDLARIKASDHPAAKVALIPMLFDVLDRDTGKSLAQGLETMLAAVDAALDHGATLLLLTDAGAGPDKAPMPSLLAVSAVHQHLLRQELRHACSILVDTGEAREVMHIAQLLAFGASGVHPRVALSIIDDLAAKGELGAGVRAQKARTAYANAVHKGLLKCFSRLGISTLRSFANGQSFEAVGLGKELIDAWFTGTPSRLGGIGRAELAADVLTRHCAAFEPQRVRDAERAIKNGGASCLPDHGRHRYRKDGERHMWTPSSVRALQKAVRENDWDAYQAFARESDEQLNSPVALRGLLAFTKRTPVPLDSVEPEASILKRVVGAAMSYGSISPEAHEAIAVAYNRVGARSNCGEGGEAPERSIVRSNGDDPRSRIRQIASGRFGVTAQYLIHADEVQIKMAQGAKPGEGGQLPAHKVLPDIARVRHTTAGVTLISPPPHHDIYSIEDLAQLIYDLKSLKPGVRVSVKLAAGTGIGAVAAGVAKAGADGILISGHDGGTGASPRSAIEYVGLPWEMGLAEARAALCANSLRSRVSLQCDGQLRTGKDLVMAAMLGADEYGLGTGLLVALGCCLLRVCHLGTCAVGIAAQSSKRRARFPGSADHVERYLRFLARDMRLHMARLGFHTVAEMIGRADCLAPAPLPESLPKTQAAKLRSLNLAPLLVPAHDSVKEYAGNGERDGSRKQASYPAPAHTIQEPPLNAAMFTALEKGMRHKRPCRFEGRVANTDRAVGSRVAGELARLYGEQGLAPGSVHIELCGTAGQSAGAFLTRGVFLRIQGESNDYTGKGLSGGVIALARPADFHNRFETGAAQAITGNVALYGATSGEAYFAGSAGERFAVRNSGALAVVEGVGDHACEYMTGGVVVVLGSTGYNFAAGMSGGIAYVYDRSEQFQNRCCMDGVDLESVWRLEDVRALRTLLTNHARHTGSKLATTLLDDWQAALPLFLKVTPIEYQRALERLRHSEGRDIERLAATEEVWDALPLKNRRGS